LKTITSSKWLSSLLVCFGTLSLIKIDSELNLIAELDSIVIHQDDTILESMNDWCKQHHGESGLTAQVRASNISIEQAEDMVLNFVKQYVTSPRLAPLAGNSVYMDRFFMK